ncbi:hypothetical protein Tco_0803270 [Tanacetum coccineum]|uniref:Uncharacterized protein n=1 Tax=Tanacetum coccineum TaxID=301880 RepID=A0ABQ5A223_9ASTR
MDREVKQLRRSRVPIVKGELRVTRVSVTGVHLSGSGVRPRMGRDPCGCDIGWDRPWAVPSHCGLLGLSPLLAV